MLSFQNHTQDVLKSQIRDCRYGTDALAVIGDNKILAVDGESDWQGQCAILTESVTLEYTLIYWSWGSCSGCDHWEAIEASAKEIQDDMRKQASHFDNFSQLFAFAENSFYKDLVEAAFPVLFKAWCTPC